MLQRLLEKITGTKPPKTTEQPPEIVDETDILIAKFERDMGKFPFHMLWPQPEESGMLIKMATIGTFIFALITMIVVIVK